MIMQNIDDYSKDEEETEDQSGDANRISKPG